MVTSPLPSLGHLVRFGGPCTYGESGIYGFIAVALLGNRWGEAAKVYKAKVL